MRQRLRRRRNPTGIQPTPVECRRRSRAALEGRVLALVRNGTSLAAIAGCDHMPRHATFQRWLSNSDFRARTDAARATRTHLLADDMIRAADQEAGAARGRKRIAAVKRQMEARKLMVKMMADETGANDERDEGKAPTDKDIAILEAAVDRMLAAASAQATSVDKEDDADRDERNGDDGEPDSASSSPEDEDDEKAKDDETKKPASPPVDDAKKSPWKPDTPTYVRFDVGGGFDVSNQRDDEGTGMADYDPFAW